MRMIRYSIDTIGAFLISSSIEDTTMDMNKSDNDSRPRTPCSRSWCRNKLWALWASIGRWLSELSSGLLRGNTKLNMSGPYPVVMPNHLFGGTRSSNHALETIISKVDIQIGMRWFRFPSNTSYWIDDRRPAISDAALESSSSKSRIEPRLIIVEIESIKLTFNANRQPTYMQSPMQKIEANTAIDIQAPLLSVCIRLIIWIEIIRVHSAWW